MVKIAASILAADFAKLGEHIAAAQAGGADYIHVDVMDGHFVPNITAGPILVDAARRSTTLPLDVHLMITNPDQYLERFVEAGADILTVHQETCPHLHRTLQTIRALGAKPGVTINPGTSLSVLDEVLEYVDLVLIMTVNPGFGGQQFIPSMPAKIRRLRDMLDRCNPTCDVEVDGGVNSTTCETIVSAGANVLVAGAAIFSAKVGIAEAIMQLRHSAARAEAS